MPSWIGTVTDTLPSVSGPLLPPFRSNTSDAAEDAGEAIRSGRAWEGITRAMTGGLIDPETGSAWFVDTDGDFYQGEYGQPYEGPTGAGETILEGSEEAAEEAGEAAAEAAREAADTAGRAVWAAMPSWVKALLGVGVLAVLVQSFAPAIQAAATAEAGDGDGGGQ